MGFDRYCMFGVACSLAVAAEGSMKDACTADQCGTEATPNPRLLDSREQHADTTDLLQKFSIDKNSKASGTTQIDQKAGPYALKSPWANGMASDCSRMGCWITSGTPNGLASCQTKCDNEPSCNVINFIPDGADGSGGPGGCCLRKCNGEDLNLTTTWKGWDVYAKQASRAPSQRRRRRATGSRSGRRRNDPDGGQKRGAKRQMQAEPPTKAPTQQTIGYTKVCDSCCSFEGAVIASQERLTAGQCEQTCTDSSDCVGWSVHGGNDGSNLDSIWNCRTYEGGNDPSANCESCSFGGTLRHAECQKKKIIYSHPQP